MEIKNKGIEKKLFFIFLSLIWCGNDQIFLELLVRT